MDPAGHGPVAHAAPVATNGARIGSPPDALHARIMAELKVFTDWLAAYQVEGYIGEVGWPNDAIGDGEAWNALAEAWFARADTAGLWVTYWDSGESRNSYPLAAYKPQRWMHPVSLVDTQARVLEAHHSTERYKRGVYLITGARSTPYQDEPTSSFSNANPGRYGATFKQEEGPTNYKYEESATFEFLASRGINLVTVGFRWERLQPTLNAPLNPTELQRLRDAVSRAERAGLEVIIQPFNKGAYYLFDGTAGVKRMIGSTECSRAHFSDLWVRLSDEFKHNRAVIAYGLMNEPSGSLDPKAWEATSQEALEAIRANGDGKLIMVPGASWSALRRWSTTHPAPWITDPLNNFKYEAHQYFDAPAAGAYAYSYEVEVAAARHSGYGPALAAR